MTKEKDDDLFPVYCPNCQKTVNAVSWKLLEKARKVVVGCPGCNGFIQFDYNGENVSITHG
jgi:endogenous inhibitor of DNA gyrase (YacG/DUF329 family)